MAEGTVVGFNSGNEIEEIWEAQLLYDNKKLRKRSGRNAFILAMNHPDLQGKFTYNAFNYRPIALKPLPWTSFDGYPRELTDEDAIHFSNWCDAYGLIGISKTAACDTLDVVCKEKSYHPLRDYLWNLSWDGKSRIDGWLNYYCGAQDNEYTRLVGRKFLIGAVARALRPGCKMDNMLILEGRQGIGKSSLCKQLFGAEFMTDSLSAIGSKDAAQELHGKWCIEIAELAQFGKVDMRHVKASISKDTDRFRPPFGRMPKEFKRHCVFVGTCNPGGNGWQRDETGARRFWPVKVVNVDIPGIIAERDQIWAEAVSLFRSQERWWLEGAEVTLAEGEQDDRYDEDVWMPKIQYACKNSIFVQIPQILATNLGVETHRQDRNSQIRVANCLRKLGFEKTTRRIEGEPTKVWTRVTENGQTTVTPEELALPISEKGFTRDTDFTF